MSTNLIDLFESGNPFEQMTPQEISSLYCQSAENGAFDLVQAMTPFVEKNRTTIPVGKADIVHMGFAYAAYEGHSAIVDYLWDFVDQKQHSDCVSAAGERGRLDMLQKYLKHYPLDGASFSHRHALMNAARYRKRDIVELMTPFFFPLDMQKFAQDVMAAGDWVDQMALDRITKAQRAFQEQADMEQHARIANAVDGQLTPTKAIVRKL